MPDPKAGTGPKLTRLRWFAPRQNLQFEIEAARAELEWLRSAPKGSKSSEVSIRGDAAIERCSEFLREAKRAFRVPFPRELIVWQHLFLIRQDILFAVPFDQLPARWETINRRLKSLDRNVSNYWGTDEFAEWASGRLKASGGELGGYDAELRSKLREARKSVDDRVTAQLWKTISMRRRVATVSLGVVLTSAALIALLQCFPCIACWPPDGLAFSLITMFLAGGLGAQLSTLFVRRENSRPFEIPLLNLAFVRPIIGGVAGLLLALLLSSDLVIVKNASLWGYHGLAIAFGFSEHAIYGTLSSIARRAEASVAEKSM